VIFLSGYFKKEEVNSDDNLILNEWPNVKAILDKPIKPAILLKEIKNLKTND
jgi:hypothetical protein